VKITLKNVRGFEGAHEFEIRPLTILIGENSSGKTTLLAAISAVLNSDYPTAENLFNRPPFELGSFDTIATYRGGKFGRAESFSIAWEASKGGSAESIEAQFISDRGVPRLNQIIVKNEFGTLSGQVNEGFFDFQLNLKTKNKRGSDLTNTVSKKVVKFKINLLEEKHFKWQNLLHYFIIQKNRNSRNNELEDEEIFQALLHFRSRALMAKPHATALAPLRTRPRRTYDELNEVFKPEGDHVPLVLERLLQNSKGSNSDELNALHKFGLASGLFEKIDVKRMGKQPSDPFQVRIKMKGPDANLVDVGYGVSQSLPIVIDSIMAPKNEVLLVQQPEVHLHPKAQAALGTFFVDLAANASKQFVVETHSDYLIDRIRISVAEGKISESKVQLLYLERNGLDIKVHTLKLDSLGNITNAPANYRNFFLEEEIKLMNRAS
jgi:predicted ATP-dependent endonuclease of OLD family